MVLMERIEQFEDLFNELLSTNSRNEKQLILERFRKNNPLLCRDLEYIIETISGQHPIGFTFCASAGAGDIFSTSEDLSIADMIMFLETRDSLTEVAIRSMENTLGPIIGSFLEPIVNRTLKLGIGKSVLPKQSYTPMLAKTYKGEMLHNDVYVTEKLDGNRCLAWYKDNAWHFTSRSGKPLNVMFDMSNMPTEFVYDGEIMTAQQTEDSINRYKVLCGIYCNRDFPTYEESQRIFSKLSGMVNSKEITTKGLVYNIFDVVSDLPYYRRRLIINNLSPASKNIRILPVLYMGTDREKIDSLLDKTVATGGEGIMLNKANEPYMQKRTDALLKYKKVQTLDMRVVGIEEGQGKYEGLVGALQCYLVLASGKEIYCDVGTGLSDSQRTSWATHPEYIVGKIIEVGYHEITQNAVNDTYSLRFPRLIRVRDDKTETSEY